MNALPRGTSLLCGLLLAMGDPVEAALVSVYEFNGTFDDSLGNGQTGQGEDGPLVASNVASGVFSADQWTWTAAGDPGVGLTLDAAATLAGNYSLGIRGVFLNVTSYRKLIDFSNQLDDRGLYMFNGSLTFYFDGPPGPTRVADREVFDMVLTRNGTTGEVAGYMNGNPVPEFTFIDVANAAQGAMVGNVARFGFFHDDKLTLGEWSNGGVREIRVWDAPLAPSAIPSAFAGIPEPGTGLLMAMAAGWICRRRARGNRPGARRPMDSNRPF